jgi:hypothetical protein
MSYPATAKEARAIGEKFYLSSKPCLRGHVAPRRADNGTCTACSKEKNNRWRALNRETIRQCNPRYYRANTAKVRAINGAWAERNPERRKEGRRAFYLANKAMYRAYTTLRRRAIRQSPAWARTPDHLARVKAIYEEAAALTRDMGVLHHVDHIVPLRGKNVCGLHVYWNLRVVPATENWSKYNKLQEA